MRRRIREGPFATCEGIVPELPHLHRPLGTMLLDIEERGGGARDAHKRGRQEGAKSVRSRLAGCLVRALNCRARDEDAFAQEGTSGGVQGTARLRTSS